MGDRTPSRTDYLLNPQPRPLSKRGWAYAAIAIAIIGVAMGLIGFRYQNEGSLTIVGGLERPAGDGVIAVAQPVTMNAANNTVTVRLTFQPNGMDLADLQTGTLTKSVRVSVATSDGVKEFFYPKGSHMGSAQVDLGTDGDVAGYPFDAYTANFSVIADEVSKDSSGAWNVLSEIPVGMDAGGKLSGWDVSVDVPTTMSPVGMGSMTLDRAFTTQLFAIIILVMMVLISLTVLWISLLVVSGRRKMEVALLGWFGAVLFALPLLRNSLPGAPPIGAYVDVLVFCWVLIGAMSAMLLAAVAWVRTRRVELQAHKPHA